MKIKFSKHEGRILEKLQPKRFKKGNIFTTFRAYEAKKDVFYSKNIGREFYVVMEDKVIGKAILLKKEYRWSYRITLREIRGDTFHDWRREDFNRLMKRFYSTDKVFGLWLTFKITDVEYEGEGTRQRKLRGEINHESQMQIL